MRKHLSLPIHTFYNFFYICKYWPLDLSSWISFKLASFLRPKRKDQSGLCEPVSIYWCLSWCFKPGVEILYKDPWLLEWVYPSYFCFITFKGSPQWGICPVVSNPLKSVNSIQGNYIFFSILLVMTIKYPCEFWIKNVCNEMLTLFFK